MSIKGEAKLKVASDANKGSVTLFVAVSRPASLHLESLDFFGRPQAVLVCDGVRFAFLNGQDGTFYQGPASPRNVSRFLPVALRPQDWVLLLLGEVPRLPGDPAAFALDVPAASYQVKLESEGARQTLWIDPATFRLRASRVEGRAGYYVAFDDLEDLGGAPFPRHLALEVPRPASRWELRYTDVAPNEVIDPELFHLTPPPGARVIAVDDQGTELR